MNGFGLMRICTSTRTRTQTRTLICMSLFRLG